MKNNCCLLAILSLAVASVVPGAAQDAPPGPPRAHLGMRIMEYEQAFPGKVVTGRPYSARAETERIQALSDGNKIVQTSTAQEYRDGQGRTRRERTSGPVGPWGAQKDLPPLVAVNDPVAGLGYLLDTTRKVAYRHPLPGTDMPIMSKLHEFELRDGDARERETLDLGTQTVNGVTAQGTQTTITIPAGSIGNQLPIVIIEEKWISPDLQVVVKSTRTDPRFGDVNYNLTGIKLGEPNPSLFQVPPDYAVKEGRGPALFRQPKEKPAGSN